MTFKRVDLAEDELAEINAKYAHEFRSRYRTEVQPKYQRWYADEKRGYKFALLDHFNTIDDGLSELAYVLIFKDQAIRFDARGNFATSQGEDDTVYYLIDVSYADRPRNPEDVHLVQALLQEGIYAAAFGDACNDKMKIVIYKNLFKFYHTEPPVKKKTLLERMGYDGDNKKTSLSFVAVGSALIAMLAFFLFVMVSS